MILFT